MQSHLCEDEDILVSFCPSLLFVHFDDAMHNGDISTIDVKHHHLPSSEWLPAHVQEQDVPAVESWLHAPTQYNNHLPNLICEDCWCLVCLSHTWVIISKDIVLANDQEVFT